MNHHRWIILSKEMIWFSPLLQVLVTSLIIAMSTTKQEIDETGRCLCGAVKFRVRGQIQFSELCHCRACSWAASVSPVHILGVESTAGMPIIEYLSGADEVVVTKGLGTMRHARCSECMAQVYQTPDVDSKSFVALFPPTFHIGGEDSVQQKLPEEYLPQYHSNYENRARDVEDSLPKYKTFPTDNEMNNDGSLKETS